VRASANSDQQRHNRHAGGPQNPALGAKVRVVPPKGVRHLRFAVAKSSGLHENTATFLISKFISSPNQAICNHFFISTSQAYILLMKITRHVSFEKFGARYLKSQIAISKVQVIEMHIHHIKQGVGYLRSQIVISNA